MWLLSWVSFFADVSSEMMYPLLPLFLVGVLGSSRTQLGIVEGAAALIVATMTAFAGFRSDRQEHGRGRVPWIRWGYGLPVVGKATIALATAWPLVLGGRLLDRFGKGLRGAPRDALVADAVTHDQRGRAYGLHRAFDTAGALVGVLLSALLLWWLTGTPRVGTNAATASAATPAPAWVYRAIFGVGSALGLASLVLTFLVRESEPHAEDRDRPAARTPTATHRSTPGTIVTPTTLPQTGWLGLPPAYWLVVAVQMMFSLAASSDTFLLLRVSDFGFAPWAVVLVYALYNLTYSVLSYPAGVLSDRLGRWRVIAVGWAIYAGVYLGFALLPARQSWGLWLLMAVYGVYMALTDGVGKALVADHAPPAKRGTAMGVFYALTGVTTLGASLLTGVVWDRFGPRTAFLTGAGFASLALLTLPFVIRRRTP